MKKLNNKLYIHPLMFVVYMLFLSLIFSCGIVIPEETKYVQYNFSSCTYLDKLDAYNDSIQNAYNDSINLINK